MDQQQLQVMVVDDDLAMCGFLGSFLGARGYGAVTVTNGDEAVRRFHAERPALVLLDVVMPGMDGLAALAAFKKIDKDIPIIIISGQGRASTIVQAMQLGASDFVCKPFEDVDLDVRLGNAMRQRQLTQEVATLRGRVTARSRYTMLFGTSERMLAVRDLIERVAGTDVAVLILGESGTGKELVARALHDQSARRDEPFVKVNCAALPTELLESELFGFEKGAFTGAIQHKSGKFEFANHGTMFLDEIGDMHPSLQAKLLQVLQDGEFSRLGGKHDVRVDVRVITASNRDLEAAVADGAFREDLYFRLNVMPITLPPLRERREDIPLLAAHFLKRYSVEYNKPPADLSDAVARLCWEYAWPGNVRQLENMMKRRVVLGSEEFLLAELRGPVAVYPRHAHASILSEASSEPRQAVEAAVPMGATAAGHVSLKDVSRTASREAEGALILQTLARTHWNRKEAAEILGISYKALLYRIKEGGLDEVS
jgi:DNA-binding NtrC family response regulator